jgi:H+/Cl- antiporter ClcA
MDNLAAILVLVIVLTALVVLVGLCLMMAVGAIFGKRQLVTSWSPEQEHSFLPFEQHSATSNSKSWAISLTVSTIVAFGAVGIYATVEPDKKDISKDMNMSNLNKSSKKAPAAAPAATPDPAAAPAPAPAPADDKTAPPADKK